MIVCICRAVSDRQIRLALDQGARSVADVRAELGCASCCGKCAPRVRELIDEHHPRREMHDFDACACAA